MTNIISSMAATVLAEKKPKVLLVEDNGLQVLLVLRGFCSSHEEKEELNKIVTSMEVEDRLDIQLGGYSFVIVTTEAAAGKAFEEGGVKAIILDESLKDGSKGSDFLKAHCGSIKEQDILVICNSSDLKSMIQGELGGRELQEDICKENVIRCHNHEGVKIGAVLLKAVLADHKNVGKVQLTYADAVIQGIASTSHVPETTAVGGFQR